MNKQRIDNLIQLGDSCLTSKNYTAAYDYYEQSLTSLSIETLKDKRSKNISSFAGWTAAFLSGGIGVEDLIIIPGVTKGVSKALGVDDNYTRIVLQAICMREIDCVLSSDQLRSSLPRQTVLQRFVIIFRSMKPSTAIEKLLSLYLPDLAQSSPFDDPESMQPTESLLLEEVQSPREHQNDTAYLLYSYLDKISDSSELFRVLSGTFARSSRKSQTRGDNSSRERSDAHHQQDVAFYYKALGLSPSASLDEIKSAYRDLMKKYHPDRFSTLSLEFQELANRRAQSINEAYEFLINMKSSTHNEKGFHNGPSRQR